jgi:broad specificity phosphatase PhoE
MEKFEPKPPTSEPQEKAKFSVYFMRHGKPVVASENYGTDAMPFSEFEEAIDVQRSMDLPLSDKGKDEILKSLEGETDLAEIKLILASPYLRTKQTAEVVAEYIASKTGNKLEVLVSDLLKEVEFDMDSLTEEEYNQIITSKGFMGVLDYYVENWLTGKQKTENIDDTYQRAHRFLTYLRRVRKWTKHDKVFVATHGWTGRIIKHVAEGGEKGSYVEETRMLKTGEMFKFGEDDLIELGY